MHSQVNRTSEPVTVAQGAVQSQPVSECGITAGHRFDACQ